MYSFPQLGMLSNSNVGLIDQRTRQLNIPEEIKEGLSLKDQYILNNRTNIHERSDSIFSINQPQVGSTQEPAFLTNN